MTDLVEGAPVIEPLVRPRRLNPEAVQARLRRRYAAERRFRLIGLLAVLSALGLLALLLSTIVVQGWTAFVQTTIRLEVTFDPQTIDPEGTRDPAELSRADYAQPIKAALAEAFPDVEGRSDLRAVLAEAPYDTFRDSIAHHAKLLYGLPRWLPLIPMSIALAEWRAGFDADAIAAATPSVRKDPRFGLANGWQGARSVRFAAKFRF